MPPIGTFENNFIITRNGSDEQITLRPNITLDDIMRLYTRTAIRLSDSTSTLDLIGSTGFQTSASIGGVYVCRAQDDFGSRNISVNITVKGLCNLQVLLHIILLCLGGRSPEAYGSRRVCPSVCVCVCYSAARFSP